MYKDYYWEYLEQSEKMIDKFISLVKESEPSAFLLDGISLEKAAVNYLWFRLMYSDSRIHYNSRRRRGLSVSSATTQIWNREFQMLSLPSTYNESQTFSNYTSGSGRYERLLKYRSQPVFYCLNHRQMMYLLPLLSRIKEDVIVLARYSVPNDLMLDDNICIIEFDLICDDVCVRNSYLQNNFAKLFWFANTFEILLSHLLPSYVVILEGCHEDMEILAQLCKKKSVPSICIQQGWPLFLTSVWRNMNYDYFLTWGEKFNMLWKEGKSQTSFIGVGYLYKTGTAKKGSGITFFLSPPVVFMDEYHLKEFFKLINYCAEAFPHRNIYVREHPECKFGLQNKKDVIEHPNVILVGDMPLYEIFGISEISVSIFSSIAFESIVHETVPCVFNLTYTSNLENHGLGVEATSLQEAKRKIHDLIDDQSWIDEIKVAIKKVKRDYFIDEDVKAIDNVLSFLNTIRAQKIRN